MKHQEKVTILYIITKLELGGAQKICLSLLNDLEKSDATTFLISSANGILTNSIANNPNAILLPTLQREVSLLSFFQEIRCFFDLIKHIRRVKKQHPNLVVHTHSTKAGIWGRWAALFAGVKCRIHTIHGFAFHPHQSSIVWFILYMCEFVTAFITTHFICVSSEDVKTGVKLLPRFTQKHSIIRAAVDIPTFYRPAQKASLFPPTSEPFIFGTIACFKKQKNIFDLLKSFAYVHAQQPHTRLEIIGDGSLRPAIEQWIAHHHLKNAITLHGWQEAVQPIMARWHTFVLTSLWEGLPCAIVEARLLKLPVISYRTGGIHDVIIDGVNGLLYPPGHWQELAQGMLTISQQPELYTKLQNYEDNLSDFAIEYMLQEHLELYKRITQ